MSEHKHIQLTQSHLLRRLLQRRVESLENEKLNMKDKITQLEERLANSTQRHAAISGDGMEEVIEKTMADVRVLGERAQAEADFTLKMTHPKQEKLLSEMKRLHDESQKLNQMLAEMMEGIRAIEEQAKTSTALLQKEAGKKQEQLTGELEGLYDEEGNLRVAIVEARKNALQVQERAQNERARLNMEAIQERERLLSQIESLHKESKKLHVAMNQAAESAHTISRWTQIETAQALQAQSSADILAQTPSFQARQNNGQGPSHNKSLPVDEDLILEAARAAIAEAQRNGTLDSPPSGNNMPQKKAGGSTMVANGSPNISSPALNVNGSANGTGAQAAANVLPASSPKLILFQRLLMAVLLCLVVVLIYNIAL